MDESFSIRPAWSLIMIQERERVLGFLAQLLPHADISEVGSTAVEGAIGKQDVDIAVLVPSELFDVTRMSLDRQFQRDVQQLSSDCFQGYRASQLWDVSVQLTVRDGPHDTFCKFNALLRSNPTLLAAYNELKQCWDGKPMNAYRQAKSAFICEALKEFS